MKRTALLLLVALSAVAGAETTPQPPPQTVIPQPFERAVVDLLNEVRTKGTLNGSTSIRTGTCLENFDAALARAPLIYNPALNLAARNHTLYMQEEWTVRRVEPNFDQRNRTNTHFYGTTIASRTERAAQELGIPTPANSRLFIRIVERTPTEMVRSLMEHRETCLELTTPLHESVTGYFVGVGYTPGYTPTAAHPNPWGLWALLVAMEQRAPKTEDGGSP